MSGEHKHPPYIKIFIALVILTALEFATAIGLKSYFTPMVILLLGMAFTKAGLVAAYFMHLKFESKTFAIIVTAPLILAVILVVALMPDVGFMHSGH